MRRALGIAPNDERDGGRTSTAVETVVYSVLSDFGLQDQQESVQDTRLVRDVHVPLQRRPLFSRAVPAVGVAVALFACLWLVQRKGLMGSPPAPSEGLRHQADARVSLNSVLKVGVYEVLQEGSCRSKGLAPILEKGDCQSAAKTLHLLLNDTNDLRTTDLASVPEGCYYCHNYADGTYTLWLGTSPASHGHGAETSRPTKSRQPVCMDQGMSKAAPASKEAHQFSCHQGPKWESVWTDAQKSWCCQAHHRGCPPAASTAKAPRPPEPSGDAATKVWEVSSRAGVVVRSDACATCRAINTKAPFEVFPGQQFGEWIRLVSEPGYVLLRHGSRTYLRPALPYHLIRLIAGRCEQLGRVPIHDVHECENAAKALKLPMTTAKATHQKPRPEGCYYLEHDGQESLWLSINADNRGRGAEIIPGSSRLPICGLSSLGPGPKHVQSPVPAPRAKATAGNASVTTKVAGLGPSSPQNGKGSSDGSNSPVTLFMTVQNVEYNRLLDTPNLASVIVAAVKRAVLFMLDEPALQEKHVQVILSSGSVVVAATVVPPAGVSSDPLRSKLNSRAPYACKALAADLGGVRAIHEVSTGTIRIENITVTESPGAKIKLPSTTTATVTTTTATSRTRSTTVTTTTTTCSTTTTTHTSTTTSTTTSHTSTTATSTTTSATSTTSTATDTTTTRTTTSVTGTTQPTSSTTTKPTTSGPPTTTRTTTTHPVAPNCSGGDAVVRRWSQEQQDWCCTHHNRGCFDCSAGRSHWEVGWAANKKKYCCKTINVGCGFDCSKGPWSEERRVWCCVHKSIHCEELAAPAEQTTATKSPASKEKGHAADYDCYDGGQDAWPHDKKAWCCLHRNRGCGEKPFDCQAELQTWQVSWSMDKVDWCCRFEQVGCPLYDCGVGLANAETSWSQGKKAWCCRTQRLGCPKPYNCHDGMENYFVHWSEQKRKWCCTTEKLGCLVPYQCKTATDLWETGWSNRKKAWCCEHQKVCPRLWDCNTGASNWEVEWSKSQQAWCCRHHNIGCGYDCGNPDESWSFRKRLWCCQYQGVECNSASSMPFRTE